MANFDFEKELEEYPCANMLKKGIMDYVNTNNLKINSKKEFEKLIEDYFKLVVGV